MALTKEQLARLSELLDQVLPLPPAERRVWLGSLSGAERPLVQALRDTLLANDPARAAGGPLDRLPCIEATGTREGGAIDRHAGERVGAYELLRPLGAGGMAEVWLAIRADGAFERQVALKIPHLRDIPAEMAERFARECRILATLETPNIARLYDAGVDATGAPYIAMEYVQGEPLVAWCDARVLDTPARIRLFIQVLGAVCCAHQREILHLDLKPSNILVTEQGEVRLLDFGVARLLHGDAEGSVLTQAWGRALTPAYSSPELLRGEPLDQPLDLRSDIYSLGVVLHELLSGARPGRQTSGATDRLQTRALSGALRDAVAKALADDPADRYPDAVGFAEALTPFADADTARAGIARLGSRPRLVAGLAALLALVVMAGLLTWTLHSQGEERWAREEALPRLQGLIAKDDYAGAFDLARQIVRVTPNDPVLLALRPSYSAEVNLNTAPEGAMVSFRPYTSTEKDWQLIGESPLVDVAIPIGVGLWRIEKKGRDTGLLAMRNPGVQLGNEPSEDLREVAKEIDFTIPLADAATSPDEMVLVPAIRISIPPVEDDFVEVPAFFMDRFEVSNHEFKEFVYASGYTEAAYWQGLPFDSASGGWQPAVRQFVDLTGQPGPSTWQAGTYGDGTADYPVTGVSWFEAAAYCRYRGKELPTAYHWYRAASSAVEFWESLASVIWHSSNFSGRGLEPVGRLGSLGPFGTYDMAGNAREWLWTQGTVGRLIAGGAFNDRPYQYNALEEALPLDRSAVNGIRCMRTMQGGPASEELRKPVSITTFDYAALEPVNDAGYSVLAQQLDYRSVPFTPHVEEGNSSNPAWTRHRIVLPTGYDTGTFAIQLFLPTDHAPPYQVVFYMPDGGVFFAPVTTDGFDPSWGSVPLDFLLKSGRALAVVAFDGAFERQWSGERIQSMTYDEQIRTCLRHWRQELGRTIDHFATRKDLDAGKLGWFGVSSGAADMVPLLAVEKRIGAAVLYSGGIGLIDVLPMSEQPFNYYPRVTQPVLMLNGRWDIIFPLPSQQRMLEFLGTPEDSKKQVLFEAGHGLPRFQVEHATLDWFDHNLGQPAKK